MCVWLRLGFFPSLCAYVGGVYTCIHVHVCVCVSKDGYEVASSSFSALVHFPVRVGLKQWLVTFEISLTHKHTHCLTVTIPHRVSKTKYDCFSMVSPANADCGSFYKTKSLFEILFGIHF